MYYFLSLNILEIRLYSVVVKELPNQTMSECTYYCYILFFTIQKKLY